MSPRTLAGVLLAVALVASPLVVVPHAGQQAYSHDIERVSESTVPPEADVLVYDQLSPAAQTAIDDALTDDGVVYGTRAPEFAYSDYTALGHGRYYVRRGDTYYRLLTMAGGGLFPVDLFVAIGLVGLGLAVGFATAVGRRCERSRLTTAATVGGGVVLLIASVPRLQPSTLGLPGRFVLAGLAAIAAVGVALAAVGSAVRG